MSKSTHDIIEKLNKDYCTEGTVSDTVCAEEGYRSNGLTCAYIFFKIIKKMSSDLHIGKFQC